MEIQAKREKFTVYLSDLTTFDTDIIKGGGTNKTELVQSILDKAVSWGQLKLIVDGAVKVGRLKIHSNTTIECLNSDCGFYLEDNTNLPLLENADPDIKVIRNKNISLIGGTYNFNCLHQKHHPEPGDKAVNETTNTLIDAGYGFKGTPFEGYTEYDHNCFGFKFYGVENFIVRDITTVDQRAWTMMMGNWKHVLFENVHIRLDNILYGQNQDGLHFLGPGQFLTLRNIRGTAGDDFIAIAPDESDKISTISDVVIDGVHLENSDQGIRLLCRGKGALKRVTIRNVTGTYKSFGFIVNPWFIEKDSKGCYDGITFENIDLVQHGHKYDYSFPFLFRLGGGVKNMVFKNIKHRFETESGVVFDIGNGYDRPENMKNCYTNVEDIFIDGADCYALNGNKSEFIKINCDVDNLFLNNIVTEGNVVNIENGKVGNIISSNIICDNFTDDAKKIKNQSSVNIIEKNKK